MLTPVTFVKDKSVSNLRERRSHRGVSYRRYNNERPNAIMTYLLIALVYRICATILLPGSPTATAHIILLTRLAAFYPTRPMFLSLSLISDSIWRIESLLRRVRWGGYQITASIVPSRYGRLQRIRCAKYETYRTPSERRFCVSLPRNMSICYWASERKASGEKAPWFRDAHVLLLPLLTSHQWRHDERGQGENNIYQIYLHTSI